MDHLEAVKVVLGEAGVSYAVKRIYPIATVDILGQNDDVRVTLMFASLTGASHRLYAIDSECGRPCCREEAG